MLDKICTHCKIVFQITDKDIEFYEKVSPSFDGRKYNISTPNLCPECRQQRRLSFRNERKLYKRKCDYSGKEIISTYSPDKKNKVYDQDIWWSDKWEALDYGIDCDYNNIIANSKDCYLVLASSMLEKCMYSNSLEICNNVVDCSFINNSSHCYESIYLNNCYNVFFSSNSKNCNNCMFLNNCESCENCLFCSELKNKRYYIWNKKVEKQEFNKIKEKVFLLGKKSFSKIKKDYYLHDKNLFKNYANIINCENVSGNNLKNCKNLENCFDCYDVENGKYLYMLVFGVNNCFDANYCGHNIDYVYDSHLCIFNSKDVLFGNAVNNSNNMIYCYNCNNSSFCFGCVGLKNKSYCILNKQYTKEEYNKLVPKIIEHMQKTGERGEFFPSSLSPFGYNETVAQEYFPMTREEVLGEKVPVPFEGTGTKKGKIFNWSDYEAPIPKVDKIIPASKLPENISDIPDDILNWAIECEVTKKPFRIIKEELEFYRKHDLPIPRRHPDQRHLDRMKLRNPRKLFDRKCGKCKKEIKTTYSQERKEIVYCEECYNKEVY